MLGAIYNNNNIGIVRDHMAADNLVVANPNEDIVSVAQDMCCSRTSAADPWWKMAN